MLGLTWHANAALNIYANYGQGFESPTLAEMAYSGKTTATFVNSFNTDVKAASSKHYEIGAKWVPDRNSRVDLALYQIDTRDEIVVLLSNAGRTSFQNAPGTSRTGWEIAARTQLSDHISANISASAIDAKYSQAFNAGTAIPTGNKIPGIPDSSTFAEIAWSSEAFDAKNKSALGTRLYGRLNNLSDARYVGSVLVNQTANPPQSYEPAMPQNWMLGLSLSMPLR